MSNEFYNTMDKSFASGYDFILNYTEEDSHFMHLHGKDYIFISVHATSRMDMFCSTLHEIGHMFAFREGKDWFDEALAWKKGGKLNKLMGSPIPQSYYDRRVEEHLAFLNEDQDDDIIPVPVSSSVSVASLSSLNKEETLVFIKEWLDALADIVYSYEFKDSCNPCALYREYTSICTHLKDKCIVSPWLEEFHDYSSKLFGAL